MTLSLSEQVKKQQEQINDLKKKYFSLEKKVNNMGDYYPEEAKVAEKEEEAPVVVKAESPAAKAERHEQNSKNLFRVFGAIGIFMIILGLVYFYRYAVDNGWIGITGRIVLGILASVVLLGIAMAFYKKNYVPFSQVLMIGSLGILYFTIFATYHFQNYREALGMSLIANTILLLVVMLAGLFLGMKLNLRFVVYGSLLLGYLSAFLSGISGKTLHILIFVLLINIIVFIMSIKKEWFLGIPAQILSYIAFSIWFAQGLMSSESLLNQTSQPLLVTFFFLVAYYLIFTMISFKQAGTKAVEGQGIGLFVINTLALSGFGIMLINHYLPEINGLYLVLIAIITLVVGFQAKKKSFDKLFDISFLLALVHVGIAIPVQFDRSVVTILWVLVALGLTYAGKKTDYKLLLGVGYYGFIVCLARVLFYDMWFVNSGIERFLAIGSVLVGIYLINKLVKEYEDLVNTDIYSGIGIGFIVIWIARELYGSSMDGSTANTLVSIIWAAFAIVLIFMGVSKRKKLFNWMGVILFGIVIVKTLFIDLSSMGNIFRVLALVIVGVLALVGSFLYSRNKEKIKELL